MSKLFAYLPNGVANPAVIRFRKDDGYIWTFVGFPNPGFIPYVTGNISHCASQASLVFYGSTNIVVFDDPADGVEGDYIVVDQQGGALVETDILNHTVYRGHVAASVTIPSSVVIASHGIPADAFVVNPDPVAPPAATDIAAIVQALGMSFSLLSTVMKTLTEIDVKKITDSTTTAFKMLYTESGDTATVSKAVAGP